MAKTAAIAYLRTSSATNVGTDKDSDKRQRLAIVGFAKRAGYEIVREVYDASVSGADPIEIRPGFRDLLAWATENGVGVVIVETANRFARDLMVQELGHALLRTQGITLVAADDPDAFTLDTPTARMVRQILGAVSEFEKSPLVAKLRGARDRKSAKIGRRVEGRRGHVERQPDLAREARRLARRHPVTGKTRSLRQIADELARLGHFTATGRTFSPAQIQRLIKGKARPCRDGRSADTEPEAVG